MVERKPSQFECCGNVVDLISVFSLYQFLFDANPSSVSAYYVGGCASPATIVDAESLI